MRHIYLFFLIIIGSCSLSAQNQNSDDAIYIILDAEVTDFSTEVTEGIFRFTSSKYNTALYKYPPFTFYLISKQRDIKEHFMHLSYDLEKLANKREVKESDKFEIITKPLDFLFTINMIDLNTLFNTFTKTSAKNFMDNLRGKKIYIIDRKDIRQDTVQLIQVKVTTSFITYDKITIIE